MELRRGDLIEVKWLDIFEDPVGDPDAGELATRLSIGYFWGVKPSCGSEAFITTTTIDTKDEGTNGYCIYPASVIVGVKVIRRGKGKEYRARGPVRFEYAERATKVDTRTNPNVQPSEAVGVGGQTSSHERGTPERPHPSPLESSHPLGPEDFGG